MIMDILFNSILKNAKLGKIITSKHNEVDLLYYIIKASKKKRSKLFQDASRKIDLSFLDERYIVKVDTSFGIQYSLTYLGIVHCLEKKYKMPYEKQLLNLLNMFQSEITQLAQMRTLIDKEILASLSLLLMSSISKTSSISLKSQYNQEIYTQYLKDLILILKKYGVISEKYQLPSPSRNESKSSALMARVNQLPIKTNHLYVNIKSELLHYFEIETLNGIAIKKLLQLFHLIFVKINIDKINVDTFYSELSDLSMKYSLKVTNRTINNENSYEILKNLKKYLEYDILLKK